MKVFRDSLIIDAPVEKVFAFYTDIRNLTRMVPPSMGMRVVKADLPLRFGSRVRFGVRPRGIPLPFEVTWDARISEFEPNRLFTDKQVRGPFEHWVHRHEFRPLDGGRTEVIDVIEVGAPLGVFGQFLERMYFTHKIHDVFGHRRRVLRAEFDARPAS